MRYAGTLLAQTNDPTEIQKADLDLLKKINELEAMISGATFGGVTPVGGIIPYAGASDKIPANWLLCDGTAVSRAKYATLFALVGTTWGVGDGSKTFNLPDLVGATPAGAGTSTGYTANETIAFGTKINDQMQQITGGISSVVFSGSGASSSGAFTTSGGASGIYTSGASGNSKSAAFDSANSPSARTGATTHGKLVGVNFIIRVL